MKTLIRQLLFTATLLLPFSLSGQSGFLSEEGKKITPTLLAPQISEPEFNFSLHANYPNPVTGYLPVQYQIREGGHYVVSLVGSRGKEIKRLADKYHLPGEYKLYVSASPGAHGVYMYLVKDGLPTDQRRLFLFKY